MARSFSVQERAEQLKMCCQSIIDNAEKIAEGFEFQNSFSVIIDFPCKEAPIIEVQNRFYSKKMFEIE